MKTHEKVNLKTMAACMNELSSDGFKENFIVEGAKLKGLDIRRSYLPSEVKILNFYRFEGESDPSDSAILYALETNDGIRGVLSDAYGPYADAGVTKFLKEIKGITKKTNRDAKVGEDE